MVASVIIILLFADTFMCGYLLRQHKAIKKDLTVLGGMVKDVFEELDGEVD